MEVVIQLVEQGTRRADDIKTMTFADVTGVGRDEFVAAGSKGLKATCKITLWQSDYRNQEHVIYNGKELTVYRTYGPRDDGKIELYCAERIGNNGRR